MINQYWIWITRRVLPLCSTDLVQFILDHKAAVLEEIAYMRQMMRPEVLASRALFLAASKNSADAALTRQLLKLFLTGTLKATMYHSRPLNQAHAAASARHLVQLVDCGVLTTGGHERASTGLVRQRAYVKGAFLVSTNFMDVKCMLDAAGVCYQAVLERVRHCPTYSYNTTCWYRHIGADAGLSMRSYNPDHDYDSVVDQTHVWVAEVLAPSRYGLIEVRVDVGHAYDLQLSSGYDAVYFAAWDPTWDDTTAQPLELSLLRAIRAHPGVIIT